MVLDRRGVWYTTARTVKGTCRQKEFSKPGRGSDPWGNRKSEALNMFRRFGVLVSFLLFLSAQRPSGIVPSLAVFPVEAAPPGST